MEMFYFLLFFRLNERNDKKISKIRACALMKKPSLLDVADLIDFDLPGILVVLEDIETRARSYVLTNNGLQLFGNVSTTQRPVFYSINCGSVLVNLTELQGN